MNVLIVDEDENFCLKVKDLFVKISNDVSFYSFSSYKKIPKEKLNNIDVIMVDISTFNDDLEIVKLDFPNSNIIALANDTKSLGNIINMPYLDRVFKKPIDFSFLFYYFCKKFNIDFNKENSFFDERKLVNELTENGFSISYKGTFYLAKAILYSKKLKKDKVIDIYNKMGEDENVEPNIINWSINNAINKALEYDRTSKLEKFFNISDGRKPTAKFIINFFVHNYNLA